METVKVNTGGGYNVVIGYDTSALVAKKYKELFADRKVCIITDDNVASLHLDSVREILKEAKIKADSFTVHHGEQSKSVKTLLSVVEHLSDKNFTPNDVIIALGGGTVCDIAGMAAAVYMHGMRLVLMPTTLLAMVDSTVGGKPAVNHESEKNLIGVVKNPELVICDTRMLKTLSRESFCDGMAEIIKLGAVADRRLFELVRDGGAILNLEKVIARCVEIKRDIVREDEYDCEKGKILGFGYTFAESMKKLSNYEITHGNALSMGMIMAAELAWDNKLSTQRCQDEIIDALLENGLPVACPYEKSELYYNAVNDKKRVSGTVTLVVPERIGKGKLKEFSLTEFKEMLNR